ncbi:LysE family translocator [Candidatus Rhodobacter oscarellae]|uniref:LysE family translocator n=1 Tax=Candidatus Rhodobacter oscarellae TaxID=1675527 RepID=UPI000AD2C07F|nr:LysE family translocator [Candidatus Rhodobacter lobularis]
MDLNTLALFALTEFLLSLTPGPAVLLVIGLSMRQGFRIGFMATLGILSTNAIFFTLSALGIGALIVASATLFTIIKWIGAAYLVFLGVGMIMPLAKHLWQKRSLGEGLDLSDAKAAAPKVPQTPVKSYWQGFTLQASNPKNILFFVAILPQFISPDGNVAAQLVILGVVSVLLELPILVFYGFASALSARLMKERVIELIEAVGGGILIALGGALAASQRRSG